jgi:uncharacterized protein (TIGR03083 family)
MKPVIETIHLFQGLDHDLIALLRSLTSADWHKPTLARQWSVKDIAAHLLDGNLRTISSLRDGHENPAGAPLASYADLVRYLNELNASWVTAMKRISPALLMEWLESSGVEYVDCLAKVPPFEKAKFAVSWAGENESQNWFHVAREFTEKWHHQKQIRQAVGQGLRV